MHSHTWQTYRDFNSIKVRLKRKIHTLPGSPSRFQFHKGTIKTPKWSILGSGVTTFQFHKGTIKTSLFFSDFLSFSLFQFHKGTIKTLLLVAILVETALFQFHKGTIKTKNEYDRFATDFISIP